MRYAAVILLLLLAWFMVLPPDTSVQRGQVLQALRFSVPEPETVMENPLYANPQYIFWARI